MRSYFIPGNSIPSGYDMRYVVTDGILATIRLVNDNDEFIMYLFDDLVVGQNVYLKKRIGGITLSIDSDFSGSFSLKSTISSEIRRFEERKARRERKNLEVWDVRSSEYEEMSLEEFTRQYSHLEDTEVNRTIIRNAYAEYRQVLRSVRQTSPQAQVPRMDFFERPFSAYRIPYQGTEFRFEDLVRPEAGE